MAWIEHHRLSEQFASEAEACLREGRAEEARRHYAQSAEAEEKALGELDLSKTKTYGITAVSAASLYFKAQRLGDAERIAMASMGFDQLPHFARHQLRHLVQVVWAEDVRQRADRSSAPGEIVVSVDDDAMRPAQETRSELMKFAFACKEALLVEKRNFCLVEFPTECSNQSWPAKKIRDSNSQFLKSLRGNGNIYAILTQESRSTDWDAKYVGQRKSDNLKERIEQHLVYRGKKTSSKLDNVKKAVFEGQQVAVTYIKVEKESLRHFVEEEIIGAAESGELAWNVQGRQS